jgi:hypothetical protein
MASSNTIVDNFIKYLKSENIPYAIGGGLAIQILCKKYSIQCPFEINNIDIFYMSNTPIASKIIGQASRKQDSLRTTITYISPDGIEINLTMLRSPYLKIIQFKEMNIMHPCHLISYYNDDFERTELYDYKLFILNHILDIIKTDTNLIIDKHNQTFIEKTAIKPIVQESRAKSSLLQRLQTINE